MADAGVEIKQVTPKAFIGEGPHWVHERQCLLYVDARRTKIHRLFTETGRHQTLHVEPRDCGDIVSFCVPVQNHPDLFVIGHGKSLALMEWPESDPDTQTRQVKAVLHTVEEDIPSSIFNDGKCDTQGRLWTGTMSKNFPPGADDMEKGHLFCLKNDLTLDCILDKVNLSNGLAWSATEETFYYNDSLSYSVDAFDYNTETGKIGNRRKVFDFKAAGLFPEFPDGMCIDTNGDLWVACFYGGKVICINPNSKTVTRQVTMPTKNITSVCFGGSDFKTLFVTTSNFGLTPEEVEHQPGGATFAVTGLGVQGLPPVELKVNPGLLQTAYGVKE